MDHLLNDAQICSCHQASLGSKADTSSANDKKTCPILKSTLDEEDITRGIKLGKITLPCSQTDLLAKTNSDPTMTIKQICPLNSMSEDLLHGMVLKHHKQLRN